MLKFIDELSQSELEGKRVLLRLDFNVPFIDGKIVDDNRIDRAVGTVDFLREKGARVIILSHLENNEGVDESLVPVWQYLKGFFPVDFSKDHFTAESLDKVLKMKDKEVLLFENLRFNKGEKGNDKEFAKKLSQMADIFVNDAFAVSHREHASIVSVPEFLPHYGGLLLKQEIEHLSKIFNPKHPFVFILGGAKFETKLPLIKKYLETADTVFVGGALANDIFKVKGFEVGKSLVEDGDFGIKEMLENPKLKFPSDVTVKNEDAISFKQASEVVKDDYIADTGPKTIEELKEIISKAKTIVWNGPLGNYEAGFKDKTEALAEIIAEATENGAESFVGGGDTVASINHLDLNHKFTFVSTGGGAMLDFLIDETLPGIDALK